MKVAAVIASDGTTVVPLVGGPFIRVGDTETGSVMDVHNPAIKATQGRRIAVVQEMLNQGVDVVVAPPSTFCEHSYKVAKAKGMRFLNLNQEQSWDEVWKNGDPATENLVTEIAQERLSSHHHHH